MERTGIFAAEDEIKDMSARVPYMVIGGVEPMGPQQKCHRYALTHGLPEITGYYGCDLRTGEFLK